MIDERCGAVVEWEATGPCEECGVADHEWDYPATQHIAPHPDSKPGNQGRHPYLGAPKKLCGHEDSLHRPR